MFMLMEKTFTDLIYDSVRHIPKGCVASYGQIARLAGNARGARIVGFAMHRCQAPDVPCHRVMFRDGSLCPGYAFGGADIQRSLLESEGVSFLPDGRVNMERCCWKATEET